MRKKHYCELYKDLYVGKSIKHPRRVMRKLMTGSGQFTVYCILSATTGMGAGDQLEIIHSAFLKQKYYKDHPVYVYGIASGYNEALDLLVQISDEALENNMAGELKKYLDEKSALQE